MTGFIPRYAFWNPSTWAIPTLYWDTFSQEQRIHAICRQLGKVINYADMLGINVDDIAARLKAIEEGQLDDFIVAAIEEWFAENEPEIVAALEALDNALPISDFTPENTVKDAIDAEALARSNADITLQGNIDAEALARENADDALQDNIDAEAQARIEAFNELKIFSDYTLVPTLLGYVCYNDEYTAYDHPGAICDMGNNTQVIISSPNTETDNTGHIRSISIKNNLDNYTSLANKNLSHANSICWDGTNLFVAPVYWWDNGIRADAKRVLKCDDSGTIIREILVAETNVMAVSHDWVSGKTYFLGYDGYIYEIKQDDSYEQVCYTARLSFYNQDFAIYDGEYYISSPHGQLLQGNIANNSYSKTISVCKFDSMGYVPFLGEMDGFEFTQHGSMLVIFHVDNSTERNNTCFIAYLNINETNEFSIYAYPLKMNMNAYSQYCVGMSNQLRTEGTDTSPHKGLTIRTLLYPKYERWVVAANLTCYALREISEYFIHINQNVKLEILNNLNVQGVLTFDGGSSATIELPLPINAGNHATCEIGFIGGIVIVDKNAATNRAFVINVTTGQKYVFGGHTLANESQYYFGNNATGHMLKGGTTIVGLSSDNIW